ncbi:MAG: hypothetical protein BGO14_01445 [Chlamydiales bacterium 38-26]|nr:MAG: hypothetical protein BGO14_01445 [Chlamydiales bacterium 38-26]
MLEHLHPAEMDINFKEKIMKNNNIDLRTLIANAAQVIAPLWPMQTIIARNPLQGMESLPFEDAVKMGETLFYNSLNQELSSPVNRELIKWCQVFLDEGQATLKMPDRKNGFYSAWRLLAPFDKHLDLVKNKSWLAELPAEAEEAVFYALKRLEVQEDQIEDYLKCALLELPGWVGYIKWRAEWQNPSTGVKNPITLTDFLAVRLIITCALEQNYAKKEKSQVQTPEVRRDQFFSQLKNHEEKYLEKLLELMIPQIVKNKNTKERLSRPDAQIVFCIDVRSEPLRQRIEQEGNYETLGFAGFFGLPVSIHHFHSHQVTDNCPVLLKPRYQVFEEPVKEQNERLNRHQKGRDFLKLCHKIYQNLKYNFATPFALAETLGFFCGLWMAVRTLLPIRSVKLRETIRRKIKPVLATVPRIDIPLDQQVIYAESALKTMGLTKNFGRLVVFCGHGSQTENNPYASALDCGACGGNHGGPNGKVLAYIFNSHLVRAALKEKGIVIPEDTLFVGAEHNTTTDEVLLEEYRGANIKHQQLIEKLKKDFLAAGAANSQYRCKAFGLQVSLREAANDVLRRSSDWSEVRPEWGLARHAAFIIGPRNLTKGINLDGRCFLHSYLWEEDDHGKSLETILTAPVIVAQWINAQYFFSGLNNTIYGSGSKITHNVTGKLGIMQGNSSDLMQGLPLQSVYISDDDCYHEVMRLQVIVYAPRAKITSIIEKHTILQTLIFNQWLILVAIEPENSRAYLLKQNNVWVETFIETRTSTEEVQSTQSVKMRRPQFATR